MKGNIVKALRKEKNLTQANLAKKLNISKSTIAMIETEQREGSREVEKKISDFFNVTLDYLDGRSTNRNQSATIEENNKDRMIDEFLDSLIEEGIISDANNIDDDTAEMLLNVIKAQVALKIKRKEK